MLELPGRQSLSLPAGPPAPCAGVACSLVSPAAASCASTLGHPVAAKNHRIQEVTAPSPDWPRQVTDSQMLMREAELRGSGEGRPCLEPGRGTGWGGQSAYSECFTPVRCRFGLRPERRPGRSRGCESSRRAPWTFAAASLSRSSGGRSPGGRRPLFLRSLAHSRCLVSACPVSE